MRRENWLREHLSLTLFRHLRRIHKSLHDKGIIKTTRFEVNFFGHFYPGDWSSGVDNHVYFYGAHEKHILYFMRDFFLGAERPSVFVDVGANVGQHALFMSRHADSVLAFEPYAPVRERTEEKIHINRLENIRVFPFGLGQRDETLPFYAPSTSNLGTGSFVGEFGLDSTNAMELPVRNGDRVIEAEGIDGIRLVKIDVEGFEKEVLRGLINTLRSQRPLAIFELSRHVNESLFSTDELKRYFPEEYDFYMFAAKRKASGRRSRRFRGRQRVTGEYQLIPLDLTVPDEQVNVVACPVEARTKMPARKMARSAT
jgi:FkbM family methyltransferase